MLAAALEKDSELITLHVTYMLLYTSCKSAQVQLVYSSMQDSMLFVLTVLRIQAPTAVPQQLFGTRRPEFSLK
jgi:hypothetical protein